MEVMKDTITKEMIEDLVKELNVKTFKEQFFEKMFPSIPIEEIDSYDITFPIALVERFGEFYDPDWMFPTEYADNIMAFKSNIFSTVNDFVF